MGASDFHSSTKTEGKTASEAFTHLQNNAFYDYGHAGYTGTIAEKPGFHKFSVKPGVGVYELMQALEDASYSDDSTEEGRSKRIALEAMLAFPSSDIDNIISLYDDKWGPAICIEVGDEYHFFGYASS